MTTSIDHYTTEAFAVYIESHILSDDEIASQIVTRKPRGADLVRISQAVMKMKGGPVSGPIRTALRHVQDLPPVPGD